MRIEQQAVNLLNMWFAKPLSKAEILERIRSDQTISEPVRKQALVLAERYRKKGVVERRCAQGSGAGWLSTNDLGGLWGAQLPCSRFKSG